MKKILSVVLAVMLAMLAVMPIGMAATTKVGTTTLYVKTGNGRCLLVRSEPSKSGTVLYSLSYGASVRVAITPYSSGTWTFIQGSGKRSGGYVMTKYLTDKKPAAYDGSDSPSMKAMVEVQSFTVLTKPARKGGTVNLRLYADKSSKVLMKLLPGTELTVVEESAKWYHVELADGTQGYVFKDYTKLPTAA